MLLGLDFLHYYGCDISYRTVEFRIEEQILAGTLKVIGLGAIQYDVNTVTSEEKVIIPPGEFKIVVGRIRGQYDEEVLVTPSINTETALIPYSIVTPVNGTLPVMVSNPTLRSLVLEKDQTLGLIESVDAVLQELTHNVE